MKDFIRPIKQNEIFEGSFEACFQSENLYASEIDVAAIQKPMWDYLKCLYNQRGFYSYGSSIMCKTVF